MPKITELPETDSLTGTEIIPIVQSGLTKRVSVQTFLDVTLEAFRDIPQVPVPESTIHYVTWVTSSECHWLRGSSLELELNQGGGGGC